MRDRTLFTKPNKSGGLTYALVYVDDIIITGADNTEQDAVKSHFQNEKLEVGEYDPISSYLGINFTESNYGYEADSAARITDITDELPVPLVDTFSRKSSPALDPVVAQGTADRLNSTPVSELPANVQYVLKQFRHFIGSLNYLVTTMRPDLAVALSQLAAHMIAHD